MDPHLGSLGADFQEKKYLDAQQGKEGDECFHFPGKHGPVIGKQGYYACADEDHAYQGKYQKGVMVFLPGLYVFILNTFQLGLFQVTKRCELL